jgi:hypothetical protein
MRHDSRPAGSSSPTIGADSTVEPIRPGQRHATVRDTTKRQWLVQYGGHEEHVEADEVEITPSGVLVFYRFAARMEQERTLLTAFSPGLCWRCQLEGER